MRLDKEKIIESLNKWKQIEEEIIEIEEKRNILSKEIEKKESRIEDIKEHLSDLMNLTWKE